MATNTSIRIGIIQQYPYATDCAFDAKCENRGYTVEAARYVCESLHLNCTFVKYDSTVYGTYDETSGNVTGLIGAIYRGEFDTSEPSITPTYSRSLVITFSSPIFFFDLVLATRAPTEDLSAVNWNIIYAFHWSIWLAMLGCLIPTCLFIIFSQNGLRMRTSHFLVEFSEKCLDFLIMEYRRIEERPTAVVVMVTVWALSFLVISNAYQGVLVSQNVGSRAKPPFTDVDSFVGCLESGKCRVMIIAETSALDMIFTPGSEKGKRAKMALDNYPPIIVPQGQILNRILNERELYYVWPTSMSQFEAFVKLHKETSCDFYVVTTPFNDNGAIPMRKDSPLIQVLNRMAEVARESGINRMIENKYLGSYQECVRFEEVDTDIYLQMHEIILLLAFFGMGMGIGLIMFCSEILYAHSHC